MENILKKLIEKERKRQVIVAITVAVISVGLILSLSFGLDWLLPQVPDDPNNNGNNNTGDSYVLSLNSYMVSQFETDSIFAFQVNGNITPSINERLIASDIIRDDGGEGWNATSWVLGEDLDPLNPYQTSFLFSDVQIGTMHDSFLESLQNTEEIEKPEFPDNSGSIPYLLFYRVLYVDNTGLSFVWAGFGDVDFLEVSNFTWSVDENNNFQSVSDPGERYLSPLSAFDSFISTLQEMYDAKL